MDALGYNNNEHIVLNGKIETSKTYVPFAQKKAKELLSLSQSLNTPLNKYFKIDNTTIRINIFGSKILIIIDTLETATTTTTLPNYVNGIAHICQPVNGSLYEFYKKGTTGFTNLLGYDIPCNLSLIDMGYPTSGKTQHAYVKASMYTGFMQYAVQNMLGLNEQIRYSFDFINTDGLLVETSQPALIRQQYDTYSYAVENYIEFRAIKISSAGIYIKKVNHYIPTDHKFKLGSEVMFQGWCNGISEEHNTFGFNIDTEYNTNFEAYYYDRWNKNGQMQFIGALKEKTFDIPDTLSDYIYDDGSVCQLADASYMSDFYSKKHFYRSCSWLFLETPSIVHLGVEDRGIYQKYTQLAFNTCHDNVNSYLYGLRIDYKKIYLSEEFRQSTEYATNPKYAENKLYVYEYSVSLHKLLVGKMTQPKSNNKSWVDGNTGIYFPDEDLLNVRRFENTPFGLVETNLAPVHIVEPEYGNSIVRSTEDSIVNTYEAKGYTNVYLTMAGLIDLKIHPRKLSFVTKDVPLTSGSSTISLAGNGLTNGDTGVALETDGGLTQFQTYYVVNATSSGFGLSDSPGGTAKTFTASSTISMTFTGNTIATFEDHDSNPFYKNIEDTLINYYGKKWLTNLSAGTLEIYLSPTEFYVKGFKFDSAGDSKYYGDVDLFTKDPNL